jgi:hypothetical protein
MKTKLLFAAIILALTCVVINLALAVTLTLSATRHNFVNYFAFSTAGGVHEPSMTGVCGQ